MEATIKPAVAYSWQEVGTWDETSRWVVFASERSGFVLPNPLGVLGFQLLPQWAPQDSLLTLCSR